MKTVKLLWLLQEIEKKEKEMLQSCAVNTSLKDLRKSKEEIMNRQKEFENIKQRYLLLTQNIKLNETELKTLMDKQKEILKKKFEGGNHFKELLKLEEQSQQFKDRATILEEEQLKDLEEKERIYTFLKAEQENLKKELESYKTQKMQYDLEKLNLEQELAQLGVEKENIISQIPEAMLKKFREGQKTFNNRPITLIGPNRLCYCCGVEVTRTVVDQALLNPGKVHCESCGRILYVE